MFFFLLLASLTTREIFFAIYILQFMEFKGKYFVMSKKNCTFVAVIGDETKNIETNKY